MSQKNPTPRQQKAAKAIVKNLLQDSPKPVGEILENVGYSKGVSETPQMVLGTEGFKNALAQIGLRDALIAEGIDSKKIAQKINILLDAKTETEKPDVNAIDKGLKHATTIYGIIQDQTKTNQVNTYNFIFSPEVQGKVRDMEAEIKKMLIKPNVQKD